MPTALTIPADPRQPLRLEQLSRGLDDYQRAAGGFTKAYRLGFPSGHLRVDGRLNLPVNARASLLLWIHNIAFLGTHLLGDGFILGPPAEDGDATDVPDDLVRLLMHTRQYATQIQAEAAAWMEMDRTYGEWTEAYADIANLATRWEHVGAIRVIPREGLLEVARLKAGWLAIGREKPDIREADDPPFRLESFCPCYTVDELEERLTLRVWAIGTAFYYRDLCFIQQIEGGDEWLTIRHGVAFESISAKLIIQRGKFRDLISRFLAATAEQCRNRTY